MFFAGGRLWSSLLPVLSQVLGLFATYKKRSEEPVIRLLARNLFAVLGRVVHFSALLTTDITLVAGEILVRMVF